MSQTTHKFHKYGKFWGGGSYGLLTLHKFINSDWGWFFLVNLACQWLCAQKRLQISAVVGYHHPLLKQNQSHMAHICKLLTHIFPQISSWHPYMLWRVQPDSRLIFSENFRFRTSSVSADLNSRDLRRVTWDHLGSSPPISIGFWGWSSQKDQKDLKHVDSTKHLYL